MPEGAGGRPAVPGDSGPCRRARGVDQPSWASQARARCLPGSTSGPGHLTPGSRDGVVDLRSRATRSSARGPAMSTKSPGRLGSWSKVLRSTSCPGRPGPMPGGPRGRPGLPGDSRPCPKPRGVNQMSRATSARLQVPAGSTSGPRWLGPGSEGLRGRQAVPGSRARVRGPERSTGCPVGIGPFAKGPRLQPAVQGHSRTGPKSLGIDKLSLQTPARLRCLRGPSCPGHLCLRPRARGFDQLSRGIPARSGGTAW